MAKKEIFNNKILSFIVRRLGAFPVSRNEVDISAVKKSLKILKEDRVLGIFPEGTRVNKLDLNNAKAGVSLLAIRSKSPVLPVYIESNYKLFSKVKIDCKSFNYEKEEQKRFDIIRKRLASMLKEQTKKASGY